MASSSIRTTTTLSSCGSNTCAETFDRSLGQAGGGNFAAATTLDHGFRQPRFALERAAVMPPNGFHDLAVTAKDFIAELEEAKIGPGTRSQTGDFLQHLGSWPVGAGLRHDQ